MNMQLLKNQFKQHLMFTLREIVSEDELSKTQEVKFCITPVFESDAKYNSTDEYMYKWVVSETNLSGRFFSLDEAIDILCGPKSSYPLWINVRVSNKDNHSLLFELLVSKRFRKPSELKNKETGHPPFRALR